MSRALSLAAVLTALWLLLSGHFNPLLLSMGAISVLLVVFVAHRMDVVDREGHPLHLAPQILSYWRWLVVQIVKSNIDVARRVLHPRLPISPTVVRVSSTGMGELGKVIYANSITLTPGTITLFVGPDSLEVHALSREAAEELRGGEMGRRVKQITGDH